MHWLKIQQSPPARSQYVPQPWTKPMFGAATQYMQHIYTKASIQAAQVNFLQQIIDMFLCYAPAFDSTMLEWSLGS